MSTENQPSVPAEHGPGTYQVWHHSGAGFMPVALVKGGNLLAALVFTMNRTDAHWQEGEHVTALVTDTRSTTFGDVIVSPEGAAYQLTTTDLGPAFSPIDFPPYREQKELFAEWTQDSAAARDRDSRAAFGAMLSGTDIAPQQPSIDNQHDREGGIER